MVYRITLDGIEYNFPMSLRGKKVLLVFEDFHVDEYIFAKLREESRHKLSKPVEFEGRILCCEIDSAAMFE